MKLNLITKISIAILIVIAFSIISISFLLFPEKTSEIGFWLKVLWLVFLAFLNWFASTILFVVANKNEDSQIMGILPSINITVFIYSICSAGLLVLSIYLSNISIVNTLYLPMQIGIAALTSIVILLMYISFIGGKISKGVLLEGSKDINDIKILLVEIENSQVIKENNLQSEVKNLREKMTYSLPHETKITSSENYNKICRNITQINSDVLSGSVSNVRENIIKCLTLIQTIKI